MSKQLKLKLESCYFVLRAGAGKYIPRFTIQNTGRVARDDEIDGQ